MRTLMLSALALGALTTAALAAEPLTLTNEQMDMVIAAGQPNQTGAGNYTADQAGGNDRNSGQTNNNARPNSSQDFFHFGPGWGTLTR